MDDIDMLGRCGAGRSRPDVIGAGPKPGVGGPAAAEC